MDKLERRDRRIAALCYLWPFLGPLMVIPIVLRLGRAQRSELLDVSLTEVLNIQMPFVAVWILASAATLMTPTTAQAFVLFAVFAIAASYCYVCGVIGAMRAWQGEVFRYPLNLRLLSPKRFTPEA